MLNKTLTVAAALCLAASAAIAADAKPIKVYLMAGQSNMEGHNGFGVNLLDQFPDLKGIEKPRDDVWCVWPGKISGPLEPRFGGAPNAENMFGPELVMGKILGDAVDQPIVMFKSAVGGTQLHTRWRPPSAVKRAGGEVGDLYKDMMRQFHRFLADPKVAYPPYQGQGFEVAGFVWFQGENDTLAQTDPNDPKTGFWNYYEQNLRDLIHDVRADLAVPELPVLIYQIGPAPVWNRKHGGDIVRAAQKKVAEQDGHAAWVSTMDLNPLAHYDSVSMIKIGERGGKALLPFALAPVKQDNAATIKASAKYAARPAPVDPPGDLASLRKGLVGYWSLDDGQGSTVKDSAGKADGEIVGGGRWMPGVRGKCLQLCGGQYVKAPAYKDVLGASGNIENLTVSYWYRANYYGSGRVGKSTGKQVERTPDNWYYSTTANTGGWDVTCMGNKGGVFFTAMFGGGPKGFKFNGGAGDIISDGFDWHHVAAIYDGSRKAFEIYIDGQPAPRGGKTRGDGPGQLDKPYLGIEKANHIVPAGSAILSFGEAKKIDRQFEAFDEIGIWSRPLSEAEVLMLYNQGMGVSLAK